MLLGVHHRSPPPPLPLGAVALQPPLHCSPARLNGMFFHPPQRHQGSTAPSRRRAGQRSVRPAASGSGVAHEVESGARKIELIVSDVDGTLLNPQQQLTAGTRAALAAAAEAGVPIVLATGAWVPHSALHRRCTAAGRFRGGSRGPPHPSTPPVPVQARPSGPGRRTCFRSWARACPRSSFKAC